MINIKLPPTVKRVRMSTKEEINERIEKKTKQNIAYYKTRSTSEILNRIDELDREWDVERTLETNTAIMMLLSGFSALVTGKKRWMILSGIASGFLLEHALMGWCPSMSMLRFIGVRTSEEINMEKNALKNYIF